MSGALKLLICFAESRAAHIKKSGATYAIFDTPGGKNEKRYIHKVSKECCKTAQGKTHAVYISDITAY